MSSRFSFLIAFLFFLSGIIFNLCANILFEGFVKGNWCFEIIVFILSIGLLLLLFWLYKKVYKKV